MKAWLALCTFAALVTAYAVAPAGTAPREPVVAVDGDTLRIGAERIRLIGFDTPETYFSRCDKERALGHKAADRMRQLLASKTVILKRIHTKDRYGRSLAHLLLDGEDAAAIMVREGLAVPYDGHHKRIDWCAKLGG